MDALFKEAVAIAEPSANLIPAATKRSAWQITVWVLLWKKDGQAYGCRGGGICSRDTDLEEGDSQSTSVGTLFQMLLWWGRILVAWYICSGKKETKYPQITVLCVRPQSSFLKRTRKWYFFEKNKKWFIFLLCCGRTLWLILRRKRERFSMSLILEEFRGRMSGKTVQVRYEGSFHHWDLALFVAKKKKLPKVQKE